MASRAPSLSPVAPAPVPALEKLPAESIAARIDALVASSKAAAAPPANITSSSGDDQALAIIAAAERALGIAFTKPTILTAAAPQPASAAAAASGKDATASSAAPAEGEAAPVTTVSETAPVESNTAASDSAAAPAESGAAPTEAGATQLEDAAATADAEPEASAESTAPAEQATAEYVDAQPVDSLAPSDEAISVPVTADAAPFVAATSSSAPRSFLVTPVPAPTPEADPAAEFDTAPVPVRVRDPDAGLPFYERAGMAAIGAIQWTAEVLGLLSMAFLYAWVGLAFMAIFMALWLLFTVTGVGPLAEHFAAKRDKRLLASIPEVKYLAAEGEEKGKGKGKKKAKEQQQPARKLAVRWTKGTNPSLPPVCIPNGLGATLISISKLHEGLAAKGFSVLSYDRAGVGLSDPLPKGVHHFDAQQTVKDMHAIMTHPRIGLPPDTKWILIGPSMGSVVAQAFLISHPHMVAGFLNHDGFPYAFSARRGRFAAAGAIYRMYESIIWTGCLRPFLWAAGKAGVFKSIASSAFSEAVVQAQMNGAQFYGSLAREMMTMMDCADAVKAGWGPGFDLASQPPAKLLPLINCPPAACGDAKPKPDAENGFGYEWIKLGRSRWEKGGRWGHASDATQAVVSMLEANKAAGSANAPLPDVFSRLVVRCVVSRDYSFPGGERYYDGSMKDWSASEHTLHSVLARDGARTVFPSHHHGNLFFSTIGYTIAQTADIAATLARLEAV